VTPTIKVQVIPRLRMSGFIPPLHMSESVTHFSGEMSFVHAFTLTMSARSKHVPRLISITSVCPKLNVL
jgi:hypothetical protein